MRISSFSKKELQQFFAIARPALKVAGLTFLYVPRQRDNARILIITSKKVGSSPERNQLRRRLKELFRTNNGFDQSYDFVVITHKKAISYSFDELNTFLQTALKNTLATTDHDK